MSLIADFVDHACRTGKANMAPTELWSYNADLATRLLRRSRENGAAAAVDFAIETLERHMRSSLIRKAAYSHVEGDEADIVRRHLETRLATEGGSAMMGALYLLACRNTGTEPRLESASALNWCAALQRLFDDQPVERLETIMGPVCDAFPEMSFLRELMEIAERTPRGGSVFDDQMEASVQLVPASREPESRLMVAMSGGEGRLGLPHTILHQWLAHHDTHMLYLRDISNRFYSHGVSGLGEDWPSMMAAITEIAERLECRHITVLSNSAAGIPGLRTGMRLGAERIMIFSPRPNGAGAPAGPRGSFEARMCALQRDIPHLRQDWDVSSYPEILIVHGATNPQDSRIAETLAATIPSQRWALPYRNRHNTLLEAMREGVLADMVAWLAGVRDNLPVTSA